MILSYKYRIYPKVNQTKKLNEMLWCFHNLYNAALEERIDAYRKAKKTISYNDQASDLKLIRAADEQYRQFSHTAKQKVLKRLDKSYKAFFRRTKTNGNPGFPRFKSTNRFNTAEFTFGDGIRLKSKRLRIVGIPGGIPVRWHRNLPGCCKIKAATISRRKSKWFTCLQIEINDVIKIIPDTLVGIDMGLKLLVADSEGQKIRAPQFYQEREPELRRLNRSLARKTKYSNGWKLTKKKLQKFHGSISANREMFIHKLSNNIVRTYNGIVIEKLNVKSMVKSNLGKSISNAAWSKLAHCLEYKAEIAGKSFETVNPAYTSQQCSECGCTNKLNRQQQALFRCILCKFTYNADHNAAINILKKSSLWAETVQRSLTSRVAECVDRKAVCFS